MQVALISDIHGNGVALDAVLEDVEREDPDQIVCLGDVAQAGPHPVRALERIRELGCPVINGNTDEWLLDFEIPEDEEYEDKPQWVYDIGEWVADQLDQEHVEFIESFEDTVSVDLANGAKLLCYHGSPRSPWEHIRVTSDEGLLEDIRETVDADLLIGGHTHDQMYRNHKDVTFVNAGIIGLPAKFVDGEPMLSEWAEWAMISSSNESHTVELRKTKYDVEKVIEDARKKEMPHFIEQMTGRETTE